MTRRPAATRQRQTSALPLSHEVNWIIKASKLCNLRCRYCYEWNDLGKRDHISTGDWERLLESVRDYHLILQSSLGSGTNVRSNIIWHGGEPLLLPAAYFEEVFRLQRDILIPANVEYCNALQTNLYRVPQGTLDVLLQEDVQLGVSFDLVSGVRLGRNGNETEEVVAANINALLEQGIRLGAIVVLAGHTARHVRRVYDFYAERELSVRFLPLFDAPLNTPGATFAITERATVAALKRLFDHWIESPSRLAVWPIVEYVYTALLRSRGEIRALRQSQSRGVGAAG